MYKYTFFTIEGVSIIFKGIMHNILPAQCNCRYNRETFLEFFGTVLNVIYVFTWSPWTNLRDSSLSAELWLLIYLLVTRLLCDLDISTPHIFPNGNIIAYSKQNNPFCSWRLRCQCKQDLKIPISIFCISVFSCLQLPWEMTSVNGVTSGAM